MAAHGPAPPGIRRPYARRPPRAARLPHSEGPDHGDVETFKLGPRPDARRRGVGPRRRRTLVGSTGHADMRIPPAQAELRPARVLPKRTSLVPGLSKDDSHLGTRLDGQLQAQACAGSTHQRRGKHPPATSTIYTPLVDRCYDQIA